MKFIELKSSNTKEPVYLNIDMIGHIYQCDGFTKVGHLTHRNGGFEVTQDAEEILDLINNLKNK
jgi:hypothetical protein